MRNAMIDLNPAELHVVHAGAASFPRSRKIRAVAFRDLLRATRPLR